MRCQHSGTAKPCFVSNLLEEHCNSSEQPNAAEDEEEIKAIAGTLYGGTITPFHSVKLRCIDRTVAAEDTVHVLLSLLLPLQLIGPSRLSL